MNAQELQTIFNKVKQLLELESELEGFSTGKSGAENLHERYAESLRSLAKLTEVFDDIIQLQQRCAELDALYDQGEKNYPGFQEQFDFQKTGPINEMMDLTDKLTNPPPRSSLYKKGKRQLERGR
jgi:hypothetical protein